jgi:hypothetical protein
VRPSTDRLNDTAGWPRATRRRASAQWAASVATLFRNLRRAGVALYRSRTSTVVPTRPGAGSTVWLWESIRLACGAGAVRLVIRTRATEAIEASASPRKPSDATSSRSVRGRDLAGGVALQGQAELPGLDAAAVVGNGDAPDAAVLDAHFDSARAGVECVLEQLLDDRGGPLDDLAGGDLAHQVSGSGRICRGMAASAAWPRVARSPSGLPRCGWEGTDPRVGPGACAKADYIGRL